LPAPGVADPHARERELLDLAEVIRIGPEFSAAEQGRARAAAARDQRLQVAMDTTGYGLTQTLAAAPQLVVRWEDAKTASPYGWAVLTAALDAAVLGARAPLSVSFLQAAVPDYCTPQQQAEAPENWFEQAMAYATTRLHGAVAALTPAGTGMGQISGYTVADYLIQHAAQARRGTQVPASTWDAALAHVRDLDDAIRLAHNARSQRLFHYAIPLYRRAADAHHGFGAMWHAQLLAELGEVDELHARADAGDGNAAWSLDRLLSEQGEVDELRTRADAGDWQAAEELGALLSRRGDLDQAVEVLRIRAAIPNRNSVSFGGNLDDDDDELVELRARADAGDHYAAWDLARLLEQSYKVDELRARADAGDKIAAARLERFSEHELALIDRLKEIVKEIKAEAPGHLDRGRPRDTVQREVL
jgi:hypothetical protein